MKWYLRVFNKYIDFKGRASRKEFWMFALISFLIDLGLNIVESVITGKEFGNSVLSNVYSLVVVCPALAVSWRRMHDIDRSGWWSLIPIYNIILFAKEGQIYENEYGAEPPTEL